MDRDTVLERIAALRDSQAQFEKNYLEAQEPAHAKASALELIGLYHLAKAAEVFAYYMTDGVVDGRNYQIHQLLETHFDRVLAVCKHAQMLELEPLDASIDCLLIADGRKFHLDSHTSCQLTSDAIRAKPGGSRPGRPRHFRCAAAATTHTGRKRLVGFKSASSCREPTRHPAARH